VAEVIVLGEDGESSLASEGDVQLEGLQEEKRWEGDAVYSGQFAVDAVDDASRSQDHHWADGLLGAPASPDNDPFAMFGSTRG